MDQRDRKLCKLMAAAELDVYTAYDGQHSVDYLYYIRCERQNIPLRDHRDSDSGLDILRDETASHGNFWALLEFGVEPPSRQFLQGTYLQLPKLWRIHLPTSRITL